LGAATNISPPPGAGDSISIPGRYNLTLSTRRPPTPIYVFNHL
jgi:hypothetical protein